MLPLFRLPTEQYLLSDEMKKEAGGFEKGGSKPMYLGRRFRPKGDDSRIFNSGGAAYVLNQASLGLLASHLDDPACEAHRKCFWEDVQVTSTRGELRAEIAEQDTWRR